MKTLGKSIRSPVIVVAGVIGTICLLSILFPGGVRLLEILTYDARVKVSASIPEPSHFSPKLGTVLIDDVAMEQVNDGSLALFYAAATDEESARKLYPRQWPWPRFIHGQIVRELTAEGALGTCFDLLFPGLS